MDQYCALALLFLFNPCVRSLRALQQASELKNVQRKLRCGRASVSRRLETIEFTDGERQLALAMFYPAALSDSSAKPTGLPFFTNLHLYRDAGLVEGRHPLVMLSHGRGSNPLQYAWFAETLASQGYIVAGLYHYRANTYDQSIAYLSSKIWQKITIVQSLEGRDMPLPSAQELYRPSAS